MLTFKDSMLSAARQSLSKHVGKFSRAGAALKKTGRLISAARVFFFCQRALSCAMRMRTASTAQRTDSVVSNRLF